MISSLALLEDCKTLEILTVSKGKRDSNILEAKIEDVKFCE